ncbi:MAG TPA: PhzF family phenazine biosynthesis protein [Gemmatimonadaceae bacterium]|nr:PhzF family phenazine biosynthesis protein [Gemmatimonadaceae bacterium]
MKHPYVTADIFTDRIFGGNPLAVFPDARGLDGAGMQAIAREFNLSETVFILPPENPAHTRRLRIFTPAAEIPFAGHPTVGAAFVLASSGEVPLADGEARILFEEGVGEVPVLVRARAGRPLFCQLTAAKLPEVGPRPPGRAAIAEMLSLELKDILGGAMAPEAVSAGLPFLFVAVKDRDAVARARVRLDLWATTLSKFWAPQVMVFSRDPELPGSHIRARCFVPGLAVPEDPATGSACAALGGYLGAREGGPDDTLAWRIEQGFEMGRPSIIELEVDKRAGAVAAIRVGGESVLVSAGEMEVG